MDLPKGNLSAEFLRMKVDQFAKDVAQLDWTEMQTRKCLGALSATSPDFRDTAASAGVQARRAERLVLALDRLTAGLDATKTNAAVNQALNKLFADAQSLPDFNPIQFANDLNTFHSSVAGFLETK